MAKKKKKTNKAPQKNFSVDNYMRTKMRSLPLGKCYMSPADDSSGEISIFVSRLHPANTVSFGIYLIDKFCCGVKDALYCFSKQPDTYEDVIKNMAQKMGAKEITYEEAHNLIYSAIAYAEEIGIPPHKDFELSQYILAEDSEDFPVIEYEFGKNGRPYLICTSLAQINYYKRLMLTKLKPEDFDVLLLGKNPDDFNDPWDDEGLDDDFEDDPEKEPDSQIKL